MCKTISSHYCTVVLCGSGSLIMFTLNASMKNNDSLLGSEEGRRSDSAQNYFDDPVGPSGNSRGKDLQGIERLLSSPGCMWGCFFVTYVLIVALFGLVVANHTDSSTTYAVADLITSKYTAATGIAQINTGGSLLAQADGQPSIVQQGAGITAYTVKEGTMLCPKYLNLVALLENEFML